MSNIRELKHRIKSIKSTRQITKAMQMISALKMKKAQQFAVETKPYADGLLEIVRKLGTVKNYKSKFLKDVKFPKSILIVIIGSSRGFVGSMTSSHVTLLTKKVGEIKNIYPNANLFSLTIHKVGLRIANMVGIESKFHFAKQYEKPTSTDLSPIFKVILDGFESGQFDLVYLTYVEFLSIMKQQPAFKMLLPIQFQQIGIEKKKTDQIFEPTASEVLDFLLPEYFETQIYSAILSSNASENAARMVSMKNATDRAEEMIKDLTLLYNKTRQSGITQEILEVAMGAIRNS